MADLLLSKVGLLLQSVQEKFLLEQQQQEAMLTFNIVWMSQERAVALVVLTLFVVYLFVRRRAERPHGLRYPPGPKPLPVIGNMLDIARENEAHAYQKLAREYGAPPHSWIAFVLTPTTIQATSFISVCWENAFSLSTRSNMHTSCSKSVRAIMQIDLRQL